MWFFNYFFLLINIIYKQGKYIKINILSCQIVNRFIYILSKLKHLTFSNNRKKKNFFGFLVNKGKKLASGVKGGRLFPKRVILLMKKKKETCEDIKIQMLNSSVFPKWVTQWHCFHSLVIT